MFNQDIKINNSYKGIIHHEKEFYIYRFIPPCSGSFEVICNGTGLLCGALLDKDQREYVSGAYSNNRNTIKFAATLLKEKTYYIKIYSNILENNYISYYLSIQHIQTPKISHFKYQWGMLNRISGLDINILPVWKYLHKSTISIGVADTGVNYNHVNIKNNIDKKLSYNFVHEEKEVYPGYEGEDTYSAHYGHGTHVAGIISGHSNGQIGILGVVDTQNTIALKVLGNPREECTIFNKTSDAFVLAIEYAIKNKIRIINCSFTGKQFSIREKKAIESAKDILFIMAAGNEGIDITNEYVYPPCYNIDNKIVVAAVKQNGYLYEKSNYGATVDIGAPGENITSIYGRREYVKGGGTSVAAPFVSGVCALVLEKNPNLKPHQVKKIITNSDNITKLKGLEGKVKCSGIVNAYKSIITDATGLIR